MDKRPKLTQQISVKDFQEFYWLKEELMQFCKEEGLKRTGSKIEITTRITHYLKTGIKALNLAQKQKTNQNQSRFDWKSATLSRETTITDNYKNTENVRQFFEKQIGKHFKFNVKFMNWIKENPGETLEKATEQWKKMELEKKGNTKPKDIAPQFEYNRYLRDFLADNPTKSRKTGIELWKIKRNMRGDNVYKKADLNLLN